MIELRDRALSASKGSRRFPALAAALAVVVLVLFLTGVGTWFFVHPLLAAGSGPFFVWVEVAHLTDVPDDDVPRMFPIRLTLQDAWRRQVVTADWVYLRRSGPQRIMALSAVAPHCGCRIEYEATRRAFLGVCHGERFDLNGKAIDYVSPRGMDSFAVEVRRDSVWVRYQRFDLGTEKRSARPMDWVRE